MITAKSDQELMEIMLALIADSAYAKPISYLNKHGKRKSIVELAFDMTLAEEQEFVPLVSSPSYNVPYYILFTNKTNLIGYIPMADVEH